MLRGRGSEKASDMATGSVQAPATSTGDATALRKRSFWGWGLESEGLNRTEIEALGSLAANRFGLDGLHVQEPPRLEELKLRPPRVEAQSSMAPILCHSAG